MLYDVTGIVLVWLAARAAARSTAVQGNGIGAALALASICVAALLGRAAALYYAVSGTDTVAYSAVLRATAGDTLMLFALFWGGAHALAIHPALREEMLRHARIDLQFRRARLAALARQIRPHFVGNALNAVAALLTMDPAAARDMLRRLRSLMHRTASLHERQEVPLREELELVRDYLGIEKERFPDRLTAEIDVDRAALDAYVPSLILQPLVENAIIHGVLRYRGAGHVHIRAEVTDEELHLVVDDSGPGIAAPGQRRQGVGVANTMERLDSFYGGAARFGLHRRPEGGTRARVLMPLNSAPTLPQSAQARGEAELLLEASSTASRMSPAAVRALFISLTVAIALTYSWQRLLPELGVLVAIAGAALAAGGAALLTLYTLSIARHVPLDGPERLAGIVTAALLLVPVVLVYARWTGPLLPAPPPVYDVLRVTRPLATIAGMAHVLVAGYVVQQRSTLVTRAAAIGVQQRNLADAERLQFGLALPEHELYEAFDEIDELIDVDRTAARVAMGHLMERLRRVAEGGVRA